MDEHNGKDHLDDDEEERQGLELELDTQSQIFLDMRQQNLELLELAARVAGYLNEHPPMKPGEVTNAMKTINDVYAEFYSWIDPEEGDEDDE